MRINIASLRARTVDTEASLLHEVQGAERQVWEARHDLAFHRGTPSLATWNQAISALQAAESEHSAAQQRLRQFVAGQGGAA